MFRKIVVVFVMSLLFQVHGVAARADCVADWLTQNPPLSDLTFQQATDFSALSDWLEQLLPEFFFPPAASVVAGPLAYRFYTGAGAFLGVLKSAETKFFYLGPLSGSCIWELGSLEEWAAMLPKPITGTITGIIDEQAYNASQSISTVQINRLCTSLNDFLELQNQIAVTPQGAVAMMILAMEIYQRDPVLGKQCLSAASTQPLISPSTAEGSYGGAIITNIGRLTENLNTHPHLPLIYFRGAAPTNGYTPEAPPYVLDMFTNPYSYNAGGDGMVRIKVYVQTLGADSPRPATAKKVGDVYKITEFSSLYLGPKAIQ